MPSEKTATDRLRELLDERGVGYDVRDGKAIKNTYWDDAEGRRWGYTSDESGVIKDRQLFLVHGRMDITPEQAIAATLGNDGLERSENGVDGRGTCHIVKTWSDSDYDEDWRYRCSECGCFIGVYERDPETGDAISADNYCPNCGRKVVDE